jgi:RNA polymerase sigma-70 factor (ECF subfamily)
MQNCASQISGLSDPELVEAARLNDRDAFGELVRRHHQMCVNLAASILRDRGEAEEETQNACWKAFKHLDQFHGEAEFSAWLFQIVENQCLMLMRRRRRVQFVRLDEHFPERGNESLQLPAAGVDPEGQVGSSEIRRVLHTEYRHIPPLLRSVILLRDVKQMPMSDLAKQLGITVAAAKSRLLRARIELRHRMLRHCGQTGIWTLMARVAAPPQRVFHKYRIGNRQHF